MGKKDIALARYFEDEDRYADPVSYTHLDVYKRQFQRRQPDSRGTD